MSCKNTFNIISVAMYWWYLWSMCLNASPPGSALYHKNGNYNIYFLTWWQSHFHVWKNTNFKHKVPVAILSILHARFSRVAFNSVAAVGNGACHEQSFKYKCYLMPFWSHSKGLKLLLVNQPRSCCTALSLAWFDCSPLVKRRTAKFTQ